MSSSTASTPSSAGSPSALAPTPPALSIKSENATSLAAIARVSAIATPAISMRREWVIPPRPKPGRKPATDTPPTKRKAQNRAAQRAFRERRAARVGELEEQLEETKEIQQKHESEMRDKISRLEEEVLRFSGELQSWKLRCDTLDRIADYERREKEVALVELSYLRNGSQTIGTEAVPLPPRRIWHSNTRAAVPQQPVSFALKLEALGCGDCDSATRCACVEQAMDIAISGCGKCTVDCHCECLEETIKGVTVDTSISGHPKRSLSPTNDQHSEKRHRHSTDNPCTPLEVDFTAQFSSKSVTSPNPSSQDFTAQMTVHRRGESCGFCEEGTYCMCAEAATVTGASERENENRLAPLLNEFTPPPSDTDVDGSTVKLQSLQPDHMHRPVGSQAPANSCFNGPGTCQQCLADPKSGQFCRSLAAMRTYSTSNSAPPGGCCGGDAGGGGCCKVPQAAQPSQPPPSLSCADTYKTLSTHKNFDQASDELSTWLGRLHATPPHHPGRAPMEVEAASVMGVLKLFDRRFGRG